MIRITKPKQTKTRHLVTMSLATALLMFTSACATQSGDVASSGVQSALVQSGFKVRPAITSQQRQRLQALPEHEFTVVSQNGQNFYVWADKPNNRLYCGNEQAYTDYKNYRIAKEQRESGAITWISEPRGIPVTVFEGWAPFGQW
jgi:hypothetical protein